MHEILQGNEGLFVNVKNIHTVSSHLLTGKNFTFTIIFCYRNDAKFLDRHAWANSADLDQTADQGLHCLPFRLHCLDS